MQLWEKYPDTKTFRWYNANPKHKHTGDCILRAISVAAEIPWEEAAKLMYEVGVDTGLWLTNEATTEALKRLGWAKMKQPRKKNGKKYTGVEFCQKIAEPGKRYVAHIGGHHEVAIVDKKVWDIWDSTGGCIGNYWVKVE